MTTIRLRVALAPIGHLTLNAARVALANARFAAERSRAGTDVHLTLRLDDLNRDRVRPAFAETIARDLDWLGVTPDDTLRQSDRLADYEQAIALLRDSGRLYPCFESQAELRAKSEQRRRRGKPDIYDRAMLSLTPAQRATAEAGGKRPHWRFRLSDGAVTWTDRVLGRREAKLTAMSDPVLVQADGQPAPLLAAAVDDRDLAITDLIRAEENATDTGIYLDLLVSLGVRRPPSIASIPSLDGEKQSGPKQGNRPVRDMRGDGVTAGALSDWLVGDADRLDWRALRVAPDAAMLLALNRRVLASTDFETVADRLPPGATEVFWLAIRSAIDLTGDAAVWWDIVSGTIPPSDARSAPDLPPQALLGLPDEPWDTTTWAAWLAAIPGAGPDAATTLYRLLTGEEAGPDMAGLLPLIGRERVRRRLIDAMA